MPDLFQIIAAREARHSQDPISARVTALTSRGHAVVAIERLRRQLATLEPDDQEYVGPLLASLFLDTARAASA